MRKPLECAAAPCGSCPYRRDTSPGVWHPEEYAKLREYARAEMPALGTFLCHQTNATGRQTVCRGWLSVERDSVAARLALARGIVTPEQLEQEAPVPLYETGEEAARAGMRGVRRPSARAKRMIERLVAKGAGNVDAR